MSADRDIAELVSHGIAVVVGTRDRGLRPAVTRGWGPVLSGDGTRLELCIDGLTAPQVVASVA